MGYKEYLQLNLCVRSNISNSGEELLSSFEMWLAAQYNHSI